MNLNNTADKIMHFLFLFYFALLPIVPIEAQSAENPAKSENFEFNPEKQILRWKDSHPEYTKRYAVEIQMLDPQTQLFREVLLDDGTGALLPIIHTAGRENELVISPHLPPGKYRYRITKFDLFGRSAAPSDWSNFEIEEVFFVPEIASVFPPVVYLDEFNDGFFKLSGQNLFLPSEEKNPRRKFVYTLEDENGSSTIIEPDEDKTHETSKQNGSEIVFFIDPAKFDLGTYHFSVKDCRGLKTAKTDAGKIEVRYKNRVDFNVSVGYMLPYILYDDTFSKYLKQRLYPISAAARLTLIPAKHRWSNFGACLAGTYTCMDTENDSYSLKGNLISAHIQAVYQRAFRKKITAGADGMEKIRLKHFFTLEIRAGAGITFFHNYVFHFAHNIKSASLNSLNISISAGISGQFYLTNRLYTEVGVDFIHAFVPDMNFGMAAPSVSIGYQF